VAGSYLSLRGRVLPEFAWAWVLPEFAWAGQLLGRGSDALHELLLHVEVRTVPRAHLLQVAPDHLRVPVRFVRGRIGQPESGAQSLVVAVGQHVDRAHVEQVGERLVAGQDGLHDLWIRDYTCVGVRSKSVNSFVYIHKYIKKPLPLPHIHLHNHVHG
jgi:hypothetical protein